MNMRGALVILFKGHIMNRFKPLAMACLGIGSLLAADMTLAGATQPEPPTTQASKAPRPSVTVKELAAKPAPALTGQGEEAVKSVMAFVDWAGASTASQDEFIRKTMAGARENAAVLEAFCEVAFKAMEADHSQALLTLGLLGEARSPLGSRCMMKIMDQPWPTEGTLVDGEILEQTALAQLQAKAVDGLAYMRGDKTDRMVLGYAGKHPSRIVRAEAISAYLWNHDYAESAKAQLKEATRKEEWVFIDRLVKRPQEPKEVFNEKLARFLKTHPELVAPVPDKAEPHRPTTAGQPPKF
jgi:hypothetical protein